ncbi:uncharacterized protein LOC142525980 [Primulina tabacum]|uniref:uncharacterized protein LOC142525980 n=1 Tax=Primulina tabacum TaxID=48773 RepID=UPI003F5ABD69
MLPENNTLPETVYTMRKLLKPFDLGYEKIHACPNDCCLFRKELQDLDSCPKCGSSRWKIDKVTTKICKGVPEKVLRYFPVIPKLKRIFKSTEKVEELIWHSKHKIQDHMMRHRVDSVAWDTIDHKWPDFASNPRNLRLGLAADGFNPFGPKQPGNDIDVYLEPLVENLKELWDNIVEAYDAFSKSMFNLKAILMWTINNFPAYGNLVGCATKGKLGCPICAITDALKDIENYWGKKQMGETVNTFRKKRRKQNSSKEVQKPVQRWKKKSKNFGFPYWSGLLLRHNLDMMHVEKNVCENIIGTLLNLKKKFKDGVNARKDLEELALRDLLPKGPRNAIFLLGAFYNELCQRVLDRNRLEQLEENIAEILCMLERFMKILKVYVKNWARSESCTAECYLAEERMAFSSAYIKNAYSIAVRSNRNDDLVDGLLEGRPISKGKKKILEDHVLQAAHRYVLFNTAEVEPYLQMHIDELKQTDHRFLSNETLLKKQHMEIFAEWLSKQNHVNSSDRIQWLSLGPRNHVTSYTGYVVNGHRFHTIYVGRSTQDSGVSIEADTFFQSNASDNSHTENISYRLSRTNSNNSANSSHDLHGSITTWEDMATAFLIKYFAPSKTMKLQADITTFAQFEQESLYEAWESFKDLLRRCPHHELPLGCCCLWEPVAKNC